MINIEAKLQDAVNDAYLWVWDRTGISMSMIATPACLVELFARNYRHGGITGYDVLFVAPLLSCFALRHWQQIKGNFEAFNISSMHWRGIWPRLIVVMALISFILRLTEWEQWLAFGLTVLWVYLYGVMIRPRKPVEKLVRAKLAMQHT